MKYLEFIPYDRWDVQQAEDFDPDKRLYVDMNGDPITGILENFKYFAAGDPRNHRAVVDGRPV